MKDMFNINKKYIILLLIIMLLCILINTFLSDYILDIDNYVRNIVNRFNTNNILTTYFKILTNLGSEYFYIPILILLLLIKKYRNYSIVTSITLLSTHFINVIIKNIIKRERPLITLIERPSDYSFPSGHTMCAIIFYGLLLYIINKNIKDKRIKTLFSALCIIITISIMLSRLYLGVHYFTDILVGSIISLIILKMAINYNEKKEII